ncbi:unnamed protein product [Prorocentrum cordatum]|uniref:Uncharacterized protein n=1 Tax=Prorocentrum cordatum TaxID=2364126 RepID=A0ABN9YEN2_9DINO|nr:unnamed protein product [Polarella glacialis]
MARIPGPGPTVGLAWLDAGLQAGAPPGEVDTARPPFAPAAGHTRACRSQGPSAALLLYSVPPRPPGQAITATEGDTGSARPRTGRSEKDGEERGEEEEEKEEEEDKEEGHHGHKIDRLQRTNLERCLQSWRS